MYLNILKKDLKRKKTMNIILFIFIILASTFISSSVNNMSLVMNVLDSFLDKSEIPDYWLFTNDESSLKSLESFANKNNYDYKIQELISVNPQDIRCNGDKIEYSNSIFISSTKNSTKIFDKNDKEITKVNDGEIYVTAEFFYNKKYGLKEGSIIQLTINGTTKDFTLKGCTKDAAYGSTSMGMTRMLVSENDFEFFRTNKTFTMNSVSIYSNDPDISNKIINLELNTLFNIDKRTVKTTYLMDMITATVSLIVSICLILISMVILRFTINFTMSEEFREIGVMKAIGISNPKIRGLYITKYCAIAVVGSSIGLVLSIPFGNMMLINIFKKFVITDTCNYLLNLACSFATAAIIILFCYLCTRKIRKFSPVDAVRNGENGERYSRKSIISLGKSRIAPIPFMALNDIFSGLRRFITMILIFTLGLILILVPVNTINTLRSDNLITLFNMAECDNVLSKELYFTSKQDYKKVLTDDIDHLRQGLLDNGIEAEVFQEVMFRMTVYYNGKKASSLAFQGLGDVTTDDYVYLDGTAPQNCGEIGISKLVADKIGANIGDTIEIKNGEHINKYIITATLQSMNNMGEGIRFYQEENLDYNYVSGCFGLQVKYMDNPDSDELAGRRSLLKDLIKDSKVFTPGEYIENMIGNINGTLKDMRRMLVIVVLCINVLVTVLMIKSFITKEKAEIAVLKAIGFKNSSLVAWQSLRIGIVLLISIILGTSLSTPLSKLLVEPIFKIMGAISIKFVINPLEVYLIYPLILLSVTTIAAAITALQVRKISASETSNIE